MVIWLIIESIFKGFLYGQFQSSENTGDKVDAVMQFLPLEAMSNLIKEPFSRLGAVRSAANKMGEIFTKSYSVDLSNILIVSFWTFIFIFLSYKLLLKRDL